MVLELGCEAWLGLKVQNSGEGAPGPERSHTEDGRRPGGKASPVGRRWTRGRELKKEGLRRPPRHAKEVRFYPGVEEANSSYKSIGSAL